MKISQFKKAFDSNPKQVRAEIHQPLLSHFSLLVEFLIGKVPAYSKDSRVLRLVNFTPY